jgi:acetyl-CoA acetyltransferase
LLIEPLFSDPLRKHDCAPVTDGAAAIVLAAENRARSVVERPAWIIGFQHRTDAQSLGVRDLTRSPSAAAAGAAAGVEGVDTAELYAPFSHQELVLRRELGLNESVTVNPSGGVLCGNPMFSAGLVRIGEAASRVMAGTSDKALGHATSGPALQQNLVCVMEGSN